jgi:hypothetical protein
VAQIALMNNLLHQQTLWQQRPGEAHLIGAFGLAIPQLIEQAPNGNIHYCPSSAARHNATVPAHWRPMSLPNMLESLKAPQNLGVRITLEQDDPLARADAMDVLLAALALDLPAELWLPKQAWDGLYRDAPKPGGKAFASLPLFGLTHAYTEDSFPNKDTLMIVLHQAKKDINATFALDWTF